MHDWQQRFDQQFSEEGINLPDGTHSSYPYFQGTQQCSDIKAFISTLLEEQREEIRKGIEEFGNEPVKRGMPIPTFDQQLGYGAALNDILSLPSLKKDV